MENRILLSKMALHGDNQQNLADRLGINRQTLSRKIKGNADFTQREMNVIRESYNLTDGEFAKMFKKEIVIDESERSSATT